jgi:Ribbon-helix-helix protein, copG family
MLGMEKATKVLVTMPADLLERIDRETRSLGQTRSEFLQEAARRRLGWPDPLAVDAALLRGRAALAELGSFESADVIRSEREERDARDQRR